MKIEDLIWIVGTVDAYGAVHSKPIFFEDKEHNICHADLWPGNLKRWRWSMSDGLSWGMGGRKPDTFDYEEMDAIERYLEKLG